MIPDIPDDQRVLSGAWGCNWAAKFIRVWIPRQDCPEFCTTLSIPTAASDAAGAGLSTESEMAVFVQIFGCTLIRAAGGPSNYGISDLYCLTAPAALSALEAAAESVEVASKIPAVAAMARAAESNGATAPEAAVVSAGLAAAATHPARPANGPALSRMGTGPIAAIGVCTRARWHARGDIQATKGHPFYADDWGVGVGGAGRYPRRGTDIRRGHTVGCTRSALPAARARCVGADSDVLVAAELRYTIPNQESYLRIFGKDNEQECRVVDKDYAAWGQQERNAWRSRQVKRLNPSYCQCAQRAAYAALFCSLQALWGER
jgi:hypothetical protein